MDVFEAMRTRRSVRKYKKESVPEEDIRKIIDFATQAPSASNVQMWKFLAVTNRQALAEIKKAILAEIDRFLALPESADCRGRLQAAKGYSTFFTEAPATIIALREPYIGAMDTMLEGCGMDRAAIDRLRQRPDVQSVGAAIQNLLLAAHAMGYGCCWMTAPCIAGPQVKDILGAKDPWEVMAFIPIGVPDETPAARPRKPLEEVLEFIR
jgi:nitroreductase